MQAGQQSEGSEIHGGVVMGIAPFPCGACQVASAGKMVEQGW